MAEKLTKQQKGRLADPATYALSDAAAATGRARFEAALQEAHGKLVAHLKGRSPRALTGADAVHFMALKAHFEQIASEQAQFVQAELQRLFDQRREDGEAAPPEPPRPVQPSYA